ncbi:hypothetical protein GQ457_01G007620 [Hibiscus cannabinus]
MKLISLEFCSSFSSLPCNLGAKQPNKHKIETNHKTKTKLDSGICILVQIVSEANKETDKVRKQKRLASPH